MCLAYASTLRAAEPVILVLGDSLSAAYGIETRAGWVSLLQHRLTTRKYNYRVVNASISGETTRGGLARLPSLLAEHKPRLVIVELGANDGLRGLPLAEMRANLDSMVTLAQRARARVVLLGMRLPPNYGPIYTAQFHQIYLDLTQRYDLVGVPFFLADVATQRHLMQPDGLHPTAAAQARLLETVWPALESTL